MTNVHKLQFVHSCCRWCRRVPLSYHVKCVQFYQHNMIYIMGKQTCKQQYHSSPLFKQNSILKFQYKICLENILFLSKSLNNVTPSVFSTWFSFSSDQRNYETSSSTQGNLTKLFCKTNRYGKYSITVSAVESWNKMQKQLKDMLLKDLYLRKIKTIVSNFYLKSY